jgi:prolyl-tRNA synthetase
MANQQCRIVRRDNGDKADISVTDIETTITALLNTNQASLFAKAKEGRDEKLATALNWKDFISALEKDCLVLTPFCDIGEWEEKVKVRNFILFGGLDAVQLMNDMFAGLQKMSREESLRGATESATTATSMAAKTLCKPFDQPELPAGTPCFVSGLPATTWVLWGRSY